MIRQGPKALILACALVACSASPAPGPHPAAINPDVPPLAPSSSPIQAARWVDTGGVTLVGPAAAGGTLVLLGGRRALVAAGGTMRAESAPTPEPLLELIEVPVATGGRRLVGRGLHGVYRFSEPLGAPTELARSELELTSIGAGPGLVALWDEESDLPRFLDLETGKTKPLPGLPEPPMRAVAFLDMKEGAAVFHAIGLAVTSDGGATWHPVAESDAGDGMRVTGVRLRGDALHGFVYAEGREATIDVGHARLGAMEAAPTPSDEVPLLRWIRTTGRDPLEAVIASGVDAGPAGALVASHGLVARVDPRSGAVLELAEFAHGSGMNACNVARAGRAAWIGCALSEDTEGDLYDPFGVLRVVVGGHLAPEKPAVLRNGAAELRASPSGGVMIVAACNADDEGDACVRQPDGKWKTVNAGTDLVERGVGALADGRIAFLRNLFEGDEVADPDARGAHRQAAKGRRTTIVALAPGGKEQTLGNVVFASPVSGELRVQSPIEEDTDRSLYFVVADDEGPFAVLHPPGRDTPPAQRVPGAIQARLHGGRGVAVGEGRVAVSLDDGNTWTDVPAPSKLKASSGHLARTLDEPGAFASSDLGAKIDSSLRIGWGPADPIPEETRIAPGPVLSPRATAPAQGMDTLLTCTSGGATGSTAPLSSSGQIRALLATKDGPPKGTKREVTTAFSGRTGLLDTVALLEEEGPDKPGAPPTKWTIRWHDPREVGGAPRQWSGPAPRGAGWGAVLRSAASRGGRAVFAVKLGTKQTLVRVKATGGVELADVAFDLLPTSEVAFGTDRGEPIAWLHDTVLVVWFSGEAPRVVGVVSPGPMRWIGEPTKDAVSVVFAGNDWTLIRSYPLTPAAKGDPAKAPKPPAPASSLTGFTKIDNVRRDLGKLPACGASAKAVRFTVPRTSAAVVIDGADAASQSAVYDVRLGQGEACVAAVTALVSTDKKGPPPQAAHPRGAKPAPSPGANPAITFVRADLEGKRAEGGERGVGATGAVRKLACTLGPRP